MSEEQFDFIEEKVNHKKSNKFKDILKKLCITVITAALFGAVSAVSFYFIYGFLDKENDKPPAAYYASGGGQEEDAGTSPAKETSPPSAPPAQSTGNGKDGLLEYESKYSDIASFCEDRKDMMVTVSEIGEAVDYFDEPIENVISKVGLILSKDSQMMYVLTDGSEAGEASDYEITLSNGTRLDASYLSANTSTGLMVISADITGLPEGSQKAINTAKLGTAKDIKKGDMIYAIGAPQGDIYSISYGYVCSDVERKYLPDRSVASYDTNIGFADNASGYIINSDKEVIGLISNNFFDDNENSCFLGIASLQGLINQLASGEDRAAAGIILEDVSEDYLKTHGIENGIYVQDINYGAEVLSAGLAVGDIILSMNGEDIASVEEYTGFLERCSPGDAVSMEIYRESAMDGKYKTITVELGKE